MTGLPCIVLMICFVLVVLFFFFFRLFPVVLTASFLLLFLNMITLNANVCRTFLMNVLIMMNICVLSTLLQGFQSTVIYFFGFFAVRKISVLHEHIVYFFVVSASVIISRLLVQCRLLADGLNPHVAQLTESSGTALYLEFQMDGFRGVFMCPS